MSPWESMSREFSCRAKRETLSIHPSAIDQELAGALGNSETSGFDEPPERAHRGVAHLARIGENARVNRAIQDIESRHADLLRDMSPHLGEKFWKQTDVRQQGIGLGLPEPIFEEDLPFLFRRIRQ